MQPSHALLGRRVEVEVAGEVLRVAVCDDGAAAPPGPLTGLGLQGRVEALDGGLFRKPCGSGTTAAEFPSQPRTARPTPVA